MRTQVHFGELTYLEIKERAETGWMAVIPTGCTEQQGPHLTVDFDTWLVESLLVAAAELAANEYHVNSLVLPAMPFGPTPEHANFGSGYVDVPVTLHNQLVESILSSLAAQGFRRIVVWRGCGGHDLTEVVARFNGVHSPKARAFLPQMPFHDLWCDMGYGHVPGGHADSFATSLAMHLRPQSVRHELIENPHNAPVNWNDPALDFAQVSATGVIGDPTFASPELGARIWPQVVETVAKILFEISSRKCPTDAPL